MSAAEGKELLPEQTRNPEEMKGSGPETGFNGEVTKLEDTNLPTDELESKYFAPTGDGLALSTGEGSAGSAPVGGSLYSTGEEYAPQTGEGLHPIGEGTLRTGGEETSAPMAEAGVGVGEAAQHTNAAGETMGMAGETVGVARETVGVAGDGANLVTEESALAQSEMGNNMGFSDADVLPFIGSDGLNLLDQDAFPLPKVENLGDGLDAMETDEGNYSQGNMITQAAGNIATASYSDLPFAGGILEDIGPNMGNLGQQ